MTALTVRSPNEKHRSLKALPKSRGIQRNRLIDEMTTVMLDSLFGKSGRGQLGSITQKPVALRGLIA